MAYQKERDYVRDQINRGNKLSRNNPFVQTLLRAARNLPDIARFNRDIDLEGHLY